MPHTEHLKGWPSVTQILSVVGKSYLYRWFANLGWEKASRVKREAGELGDRIHSAIENRILHKEQPALEGHELAMFRTWEDWFKSSAFFCEDIELKLESAKYQYHGTCDAIGSFGKDKSLWILDWKTSNQVDVLYGLQLAAYAAAYEEMNPEKTVYGGGIIRISKDPEAKKQIEVVQYENLKEMFPVFLACKDVYEFANKKGNWKR